MKYRIVMVLVAFTLCSCSSTPPSPGPTPLPAPSKVSAHDGTTVSSEQQSQSAAAPRLRCRVQKPGYPTSSVAAGEHGVVKVRFFVELDGTIQETEIVQSSGYARLDEAASEAMKRSSCDALATVGRSSRVSYVQSFDFGSRRP